MSKWRNSKLKLACTLSELVKLIEAVKPQWKKHLKVDPNGLLKAINNYPSHNREPIIEGMSLIIPRDENLGFHCSDIGFQKQSDGTWKIHYDDLPYDFANPEAILKSAAAAVRARRIAAQKGGRVVKESVNGSKRTIRIRVPVSSSAIEAVRMKV